ncbi:MAG: hypothetical protein ACXWTH_12380 [Methylosarcina sp.]
MNNGFFEKAGLLAIVALLVVACIRIISPFAGAMLWGAIIAISTWPLFERLQHRLGGRQGFTAFLLTLGMILIFVIPISLLVYSLTEHVAAVARIARDLTTITLPPAPEWLVNAPLIGLESTPFGRTPARICPRCWRRRGPPSDRAQPGC